MQLVNVFINHSDGEAPDTEALISSLTLNDSSVQWTVTDVLGDADLIASHKDTPGVGFGQEIQFNSFATFADEVNQKIMKGEVILPTALGKQILTSQLAKSEKAFRKIRGNNPLHLSEAQRPDPNLVDTTVKFAAWAIHPGMLNTQVKDLKRRLDGRFVNSLQREIPQYVALAPVDAATASIYPDIPKDATEHLKRVAAAKEKIEALGISVPNTDMAKSQLNLGLPFPGGLNREAQGLTPPSALFEECAQYVSDVMLRGAAFAFAEDPDGFRDFSVRVGVKKDNFQGAALPTTAHSVRQTYWAIAEDSPEGLFHFSKYNFPTVGGFRRSSNSGKTRVSFLLGETGSVARSRVTDASDLRGKPLLSYDKSAAEGTVFTDSGAEGARVRIVDNLWSAQNDATLPVPGLIAEFKDNHYKAIFQQDFETMNRFIPGTPEFNSFWKEGYEDNEWVRKLAKERGCDDFESLMRKADELGQKVVTGDVENFDGNANHEIVFTFFKYLMSDKCLAVTDQMWHADKIGVYASSDSSPVYYYIACNADNGDSEGVKKLVERTRDYMSHVPSGMGPTAQAGRGVIPTVLMEISILLYKEMKEYLLMLPARRDSKFSALSALMNSAGDDHNLGTFIVWLITGVDQGEIFESYLDAFTKYKTLIITPEFPKMNAGFLFHDDEKGNIASISLSPSRGFGNMVFPERSRNAIGLYSSMTKYIEATMGTPAEEDMLTLVDIILHDVFRFKDLEHLAECAVADQEWVDQNAEQLPAVERLAAMLNIPINDLEWQYTIDDLLDLGAPNDLVNEYRRPIPDSLTKGPFNFLSEESITRLSKIVSSQSATKHPDGDTSQEPSPSKKKLLPLLHPNRQPGSDEIWFGDFSENDLPVMMVDKSDKATLKMFEPLIAKVLASDPSISHLSIHATKGDGWDWSDDKLNVGEIGDWVLLKGAEAVTL